MTVHVTPRIPRGRDVALALAVVAAVGTAWPVRAAQPPAPAAEQPAPSASAPSGEEPPPSPGVPVIYRGKEVFRIYRPLGFLSTEQRAQMATERLDHLVWDKSIVPGELRLVHLETTSEIVAGDQVVAVITDQDAAAAGMPRRRYAEQGLEILKQVITEAREEMSFRSLVIGLVTAAAETAVFLVLTVLVWRAGRRLLGRVGEWGKSRIQALRIQRAELVTADRLTALLAAGIRSIRVVVVAVLGVAWLEAVLQAVPWTRPSARLVLAYFEAPVLYVVGGFVGFLPNLFFLLVIAAVTYGLLHFVRFLFSEIERGKIELAEFPAEWADPTYKIVRILLIALALVAAFPYIPGSSSPAFQGVSLFLGLLVSLSSSSAISNVIAGTILTYTRAFRIGDFVQIGETIGTVERRSLLVTQLRTPKNVVVAIPNALVLGGQVQNFTTLAAGPGLILNTSVTIGYDAPWRTVHGLLISAASKTPGVANEPAPFVLQTALNDFYVSYQINAYTRDSLDLPRKYSDLHTNIQEAFNEAGVEIMSPHFSSLRDGNRIAIPDTYVSPDYRAPGFRLAGLGDGGETKTPDR